MAFLQIKNLSFKYTSEASKALDDISLEVNEGEIVVLCGQTGCGKTTLLRHLKPEISPNGEKSGSIEIFGKPLEALSHKMSACSIGFVGQNPEHNIVTNKVPHELAFALESLGEKSDVIRMKIAEVCGFFGIGEWYHQDTSSLSGGQKQLLSLASAMVGNPELLLLDEPTSSLDPISANRFINTLLKINKELGITMIIAEHRLEEVFPIADKIVLMDKGEAVICDTPKSFGQIKLPPPLSQNTELALPSAMRLFRATDGKGECPITVNEGRRYIKENFNPQDASTVRDNSETDLTTVNKKAALEISGGFFRYERELPDILSGIDIKIYENECFAILGANGSGKTTLMKIFSGTKKLYSGKFRIFDKKLKDYSNREFYGRVTAFLPQNPRDCFIKSKLSEDFKELLDVYGTPKEESERKIKEVSEKTGISHLLEKHPFDLSGGEIQKAALAKILLANPRILLLDEPTKGLDAYSAKQLGDILRELKKEGKTIVFVTHNVEFASEYAERCAMLFDGKIVSAARSNRFFSTNRYYTTAVSRMTRQIFCNTVTINDAVSCCEKYGRKEHTGDELK